jgi:tetratricopeptide (TPR) repeat protein
MYRYLMLSILLMNFFKGVSQEPATFRYADSLTYTLYAGKNWSELIKKGKEAISNQHDYYYMRMRIGIAYYEMKNYGKSALHFRKALAFNEADPVALEYLFYSYFLSGRDLQAWSILQHIDRQDRARLLDESRLKKNSLTLESFYSNAATDYIFSNPGYYFSDPEAGSQVVTRFFVNNAIYASHIISGNISYSHSFTNLIKENYLHYYNGIQEADITEQRVVQNQYRGSFSFFSSSGWSVSPSFHFLTAGYPLIATGNFGNNPFLYQYDERTNGFTGGLAVTKSGAYSSIGGEASYANLNYSRQLQGTLSLMIYPLGNRKLYLGGKISAVTDTGAPDTDTRFISGFTAGLTIRDRVWIEFTGLSGYMKNFTDNNGLIVYNSSDVLTGKYNGNIIVPFYRSGLSLFAGGGFSNYTSEFIPSDGSGSFDSNKLDYQNFNLTGGISWNF